MANNYYNFTDTFTPGLKARSGDIDREYLAIQTAFDLLPTSTTALTTGKATFAGTTTGAANLYIATMPNTRTSNTNGDEIIWIADKTNTGGATFQVDAIGAVSLRNWNGTALVGGEIVAGQFYIARFDSTNGYFVLEASTDAALNKSYAEEWANAATNTLVSAAAGGNLSDDYSARHQADAAQDWAIRAEDDLIPTTFGGNGVDEYSAYHWAQKAAGATGLPITSTAGATIRSNGTGWDEETEFRVGVSGSIYLAEQATAEIDIATFGQIFVRSADDVLMYRDEGGSEFELSASPLPTPVTHSLLGSTDGIDWTVISNLDYDTANGRLTFDKTATGAAEAIRIQNIPGGGAGVVMGGSGSGSSNWVVWRSIDNGGANYWQVFDDHGLSSANHKLEWQHNTVSSPFIEMDSSGEMTLGGSQSQGTLQIQGIGGTEYMIILNNGNGGVYFEEQASQGAVGAGDGQLWVRNDAPNVLMFTDDAGTDFQISDVAFDGVINADINTATPPTSEAPTGAYTINDLADDDQLMSIGFEGSNILKIRNNMAASSGANIDFHLETTSADAYKMSWTTGGLRMNSSSSASTDSVAFEQTLQYRNRSGVVHAEVGFKSADDWFQIKNHNEGNAVIVRTTRQGSPGTETVTAQFNPHGNVAINGQTGGVVLYYQEQFLTGFPALRTTTTGSGVVQVNTDGSGTWERVLTSSDNDSISSGGTSVTASASAVTIAGMDETDTGLELNDGMRITFEDTALANTMYIRNEGAGGSAGTLTIRRGTATTANMELIGVGLRWEDSGETVNIVSSVLTSPTRLNFNEPLRIQGPLYMLEQSSADTDVAGDGQIWIRNYTVNQPWYTDDAGVDRPFAFAVTRRVATNAAWNMNTGNNDYNSINGLAYYDDGSAYTITTEDSGSTNWPVDCSFQILARGGGTITISEGSGVTMYTDDGTGFADSTGSSTLVDGVATLYRASATVALLWGSGLTI